MEDEMIVNGGGHGAGNNNQGPPRGRGGGVGRGGPARGERRSDNDSDDEAGGGSRATKQRITATTARTRKTIPRHADVPGGDEEEGGLYLICSLRGRRFYACPKPESENSCGFHSSVDDTAGPRQSSELSRPVRKRSMAGSVTETSSTRPRVGTASTIGEEVRCDCKLEASRRIVGKDALAQAFKVELSAQVRYGGWRC
ncbi:hypothetical protein CROQUDRAFT_129671 [Cronartium quercuum f. sp. fusiforme G11]|uniref:Uncharacterized protein n=1 Tax=Cronartium quercuum f. sp. fusiforme G11 TaxID=708437 RepID=A0A9P6NRW2_9BASI|nr:hypothetical protein CROQUDRAFT_129671 [Cronartium quercuum f. sp. fusiforme G11]